jgi:hypothetical protein
MLPCHDRFGPPWRLSSIYPSRESEAAGSVPCLRRSRLRLASRSAVPGHGCLGSKSWRASQFLHPVMMVLNPQKQKKPTWWNTLRYSTTPAYSLTSPPAVPGCSSPSCPTTSLVKPRACAMQLFRSHHNTPLSGEYNRAFTYIPPIWFFSWVTLENLMVHVPSTNENFRIIMLPADGRYKNSGRNRSC